MKLSIVLDALNKAMDKHGDIDCFALGLTESSELGILPMGVGIADLEDDSGIIFGSAQDFLDYFNGNEENPSLH